MNSELARHTEKLYYFHEIANAGSLQACARALHLSAPTLSYAIKQLEQVLGFNLFIRSKQGVRLTEAGERVQIFCRKYFRELEQMEHQLHSPTSVPIQSIKIGTFPSIAIYFWPLILEAFKDDPDLSISIMTNRSKSILEALVKREIDLAITVEGGVQKNLIRHELYKDEYAFFASKKFKKTKIDKLDLSEVPLLYIPDAQDETGTTLRQHLYSWDVQFKEEYDLDSFEVILEFVKRNYGIGILPTKVARAHLKDIKMLSPEFLESKKFGSHRFFLSYREDLDLPQRLMDHFLNSAQKAVQTLNEFFGT